jgi:SAM-dependent methyltransferase
MAGPYDPDHVRRYYDAWGEREWSRLEANPPNVVSFHVHRHYLERFIGPGDHALEAGAGAGRFTIELARLGARVTVGDISPVQLALNREKVTEAGCETAVVDRQLLDIVDLSRFPAGHFDATVCYGGAISYVFDRADAAVGELLRVTKPGGYLLLSVMSLAGSLRRYLAGVPDEIGERGFEAFLRMLDTGDQSGNHACHLYRWSELQALLARHPCAIVAASAANFLAIGNDTAVEALRRDRILWDAYLGWEIAFGAEPGAVDGGSHIIVAAQKT